MPKVNILGGGVAGLSAAHELIERGYEVEVFEFNPEYIGGKARSVNYYGINNEYKVPLPGEHGFRFFPGFYRNVTDTMKRIPFVDPQGKKGNVFKNLTPTYTIMIAQYDKPPIVLLSSFPKNIKDLKFLIKTISNDKSSLSKEEETFFAERVWQLMTSCTERKLNEYERMGWWEYLRADHFSDNYRHLLVEGLTRTLVAAKARTASTKTGGDIFLQLLYCMLDPTMNTDRILKGPTNDMWLNPWKEYLISQGVVINQGWICTNLEADKQSLQIKNATVAKLNVKTRKPSNETRTLTGDHFIMAMPVERAAELISADLIKCDKTLEFIPQLAYNVNWMNGIQYYLNEDVVLNQGHVIFADTEYALTAISQIQFWKGYPLDKKANGNIKGILSVDISDWFTKGYFNKLEADNCTREGIADEVWKQLMKSLNVNGKTVLTEEMRVDFYLDRDIQLEDGEVNFRSVYDNSHGRLVDKEPLLVNNANTWNLRPEASCQIENLYFASDYVRTYTDLATMEGANEAARRAVNCILDNDKSSKTKCKVWGLREPWYLKPLKWHDLQRFKKGIPWTIHAPLWLEIITAIGAFIYIATGLIKEFFFPRRKKNTFNAS
jgi:uncharacterized protein with NAD-binding domain and iron-sulfur cluster